MYALGNPLGLAALLHEGDGERDRSRPREQAGPADRHAHQPGQQRRPLIDDSGAVAGVVAAKMRLADGLGFAIPVDVLAYYLDHMFPRSI